MYILTVIYIMQLSNIQMINKHKQRINHRYVSSSRLCTYTISVRMYIRTSTIHTTTTTTTTAIQATSTSTSYIEVLATEGTTQVVVVVVVVLLVGSYYYYY